MGLRELLKPELLATWLRQQEPTAVVGHANYDFDCVIARYLRDAGYWYACVDEEIDASGHRPLRGGTIPIERGSWIDSFIQHVDDGRREIEPVEAAFVLECLEAALADFEAGRHAPRANRIDERYVVK